MKHRLIVALLILSVGSAAYLATVTPHNPTNYVLIGAPGSGKGTLANILSKNTGIPVLTVSTVLKKAMKTNAGIKKAAEQAMSEGRFVSDEVITQVLLKEVKSRKYAKGVIFDGFPRTMTQSKFFSDNNIPIDYFVVLDIEDDVIIERMQGRRTHIASGRTYHIVNNPPKVEGKDDVTGEPLTIRDDDQPKIVKQRLKDYHKLTKPIISWAMEEEQNLNGIVKQIIVLDATKSPDDVWQSLTIKLPSCSKVSA